MTKHFNLLAPAEDERLALLMEEAAEVIQVIGKIMRHGYETYHPDGGQTNRELLEKEIGHVRAAIQLMLRSGDMSTPALWTHEELKWHNMRQYLQHQGDGG